MTSSQQAACALARLVWCDLLHEGDTVQVRCGIFGVAHVYALQSCGSHLWFKRVRQADHPSTTHTIPGVYCDVALHNQPLWYVKNCTERYILQPPVHAL